MRKAISEVILLLAISSLIFFNINSLHTSFLGWLLLAIYFIFIASATHFWLYKFFNFSEKAWRIKILSAFLILALLGWGGGIVILFSKLTALNIAIVFLVVGLLNIGLKYLAILAKKQEGLIEKPEQQILEESPHPKVGVLVYLILVIVGFYLLWQSRTGEAVLSPWQIIDHNYFYVFLSATVLLGFLIFTHLRAKTLLFLLVVHALLLHAYLPLTHNLLYGADQWRHMANESLIVNEEVLVNNNWSDSNLSWAQKLNFSEFSYVQSWSLAAIFDRLCGVDLLKFNRWFIPIVWSIVFTILLFELGRTWGWGKKESLFFAWLGFLPYTLQVSGSFTLPVNFGFLLWLFFILLMFKRTTTPRFEQIIILLILGILAIFGYLLFFILFWLSLMIIEIFNSTSISKFSRRIVFLILMIISAVAIPILELVSNYSSINRNINWLSQVKQLVGNWSGFYLASGPRPHDIPVGNIVFNQTPTYAFVINWFTEWRWWIVVFMGIILVVSLIGWFRSWRAKKTSEIWLGIMAFGLSFAYIISRYFLSGENILARRLDVVLAFLLISILMVALNQVGMQAEKNVGSWWQYWQNNIQEKISKFGPIILPIVIIVFSVAIAVSYSLGPDTRAVSVNEYSAMNYIWQSEKNQTDHCVLADTYPLLALETISQKNIVGGGFPINQYFGQPERESYFKTVVENHDINVVGLAMFATKTNNCWLVTEKDKLPTNLAIPLKSFDNIFVYKFTK